MCRYFIVLSLLMLKILLASLTGLITATQYNYGYHPSAEEFDNLLRETHHTWTYNFLKNTRDNKLNKPILSASSSNTVNLQKPLKTEARYFVPKFQYENEMKKFQAVAFNPTTDQQQPAFSNKRPQVPLKNIGSTLDFNYYSDELPQPIFNKPSSSVKATSALPDINVKPLSKPDILIHKNTSHEHFPIYFTNPATGIVYAITEIGKTQENLTVNNGSIPIFITKEQYERDIEHLKQIYEQKCPITYTTPRPHIIKILKKPLTAVRPINSTNLKSPAALKKPSSLVIKTELTVKDKPSSSTLRPLRKKKNKKTKVKSKIKKPNPPGHNKPLRTTLRPILANQPNGPVIVIGTRASTTMKPFVNSERLSTQLEKPNFDNIFSSAVAPHGPQHKVKKRSPLNGFKNSQQGKNFSETETLQGSVVLFGKFQKDNIGISALDNFETLGTIQNSTLNSQLFMGFLKQLHRIKANESNSKLKPGGDSDEISSKNGSKIERNEIFNISKGFKDIENILNKNSIKIRVNSTKILSGIFENNSSSDESKNVLKKLNKNSVDEVPSKNLIESIPKRLSIQNSAFQPSLIEHQHHVLKRSLNSSEPKFIKKSNTLDRKQMDSRNSSLVNENSERRAVKVTNRKSINKTEEFEKNSKLKNVSTTANKVLRKRKRISKITLNSKPTALNSSQMYSPSKGLTTTPRPIKKVNKTRKNHKNIKKKSKRQKDDEEYYFFADYDDNDEEEDEDEDDDYEDGDDDEDDENIEHKIVNDKDILAYDDNEKPTLPTTELSVSLEDLTEKPDFSEPIKSSYEEEDNDSSALQMEQIKFKAPAPAILDYDMINRLKLKTHSSPSAHKKRIRRRPQLKIDRDDYDYDEEEDSNGIGSNLGGFFRMIFYPIQVVMSSVMDSLAVGKDADEEAEEDINSLTSNPYTQYTSYHNTLKQHDPEDYDEDDDASNESATSSLSSWFSSWFGFNRRNKKISSTTVAPVKPKPTKSSSSWLYSLLGFGNNNRISTESQSSESDDEYDKWFASWFGETKPKARKRTTTTTTTTTQLPHVPILTIVDPMKNPQNWIGILAHHIINHTSTSTVNPLMDMWSKVPTTTTENPEIPRKISYEKYQIWRLKPQDDSQVKALEEYKKSEDGIKLQWLKGPSLRGLTDVLVPPKMLVDFQASLTFELIDHEVLIFDVGKAIAYEKTKEDYFSTTTQKPKKHQNKIPAAATAGITWRKYYEYDDIIKYLEMMRMRFPHLVELIHIGRSYEGRPLIVTKIESKEAAAVNSAHYPAHQLNKLRHRKRIGLANAVFIEAGTHGMEWIGPATATWIINELLRIMKKNVSDEQSFIRNTTWYVMPVLNPDGYVYSHEYDRFWKKSRSRHISRPSGILSSAMTWLQKKRAKEKVCFGVDLDRNWHYQWGKRGSSKSACNEFYAGPTPFSEPETKALSEFLMDYRTQIKLFISMQSYGQIISYPYKANTTYDSERLDDLLDVAMVGTDGLRKKGSKSRYKIDSSNDLIENRSGCSDAFAAYEVGIPFSYTLQLADNGVHGYLLPSASIESTAKDAFEIITTMLDYI